MATSAGSSESSFPSSASSSDASPLSSSTASPSDSSFGGSVDTASGPGASNVSRSGTDMFARVVQGAHETVDRLAETAAPHVQRLTQGVGNASGSLHQRADQMREVSDEWAENLRDTVRENPLAALAAALAVGVIVARITS